MDKPECPNCRLPLVVLEKPIDPLLALPEEITELLIDEKWETESRIIAVCPKCGYIIVQEVKPKPACFGDFPEEPDTYGNYPPWLCRDCPYFEECWKETFER